MEEERLGELESVTEKHRHVYEGRMRLLSAASSSSRAALVSYVTALQRLGQANEAARTQEDFDQKLRLMV